MEHRDYMEQALALAREAAAHGEVPVGCVIVKDGEVIGRGRNRREEKQAVYSHAEMEAMAQANAALVPVPLATTLSRISRSLAEVSSLSTWRT